MALNEFSEKHGLAIASITPKYGSRNYEEWEARTRGKGIYSVDFDVTLTCEGRSYTLPNYSIGIGFILPFGFGHWKLPYVVKEAIFNKRLGMRKNSTPACLFEIPRQYREMAEKSAIPTLESILQCIHSDIAYPDALDTFETFCNEFGYDDDSIKSLETYNSIQREDLEMHKLLGNSAYKEFISIECDW